MKTEEKTLVLKAIQYLKESYGEDTVAMTVRKNSVEDGHGILSVDCTVSVGGSESDWSKEFYFKNNAVTRMTWQRK